MSAQCVLIMIIWFTESCTGQFNSYWNGRSRIYIALQVLVRIVAKLFPDFHLFWLVEEVKHHLPLELDFLNEATNADTIREMYSNLSFLKVFFYSTGEIIFRMLSKFIILDSKNLLSIHLRSCVNNGVLRRSSNQWRWLLYKKQH